MGPIQLPGARVFALAALGLIVAIIGGAWALYHLIMALAQYVTQ